MMGQILERFGALCCEAKATFTIPLRLETHEEKTVVVQDEGLYLSYRNKVKPAHRDRGAS
jgi:hypothetical protein